MERRHAFLHLVIIMLEFRRLVFCLIWTCLLVLTKGQSYEIVPTPLGNVQGINVPVNSQDVIQFRNIPYAKAPVGDLRFRKPLPVDPWEGTLDGTRFGPMCPQNLDYFPEFNEHLPNNDLAEDCLFLNVYVPYKVSKNAKKAVMVWIHGGGFFLGQGVIYDGSRLALQGDVILVTINYRLGMFGFMSTEDEASPGNYGLWDQIMALKWINQNIASFGGDPNSVTIFGESAGGMSSSMLMMIPENRGLFHRVIAQSGTATSPIAFTPDPRKAVVDLGKILGCVVDNNTNINTYELVDCLRSKTDKEIIKAQDIQLFKRAEEEKLSLYAVMSPTIDGELFKEKDIFETLQKPEILDFYQSIDLIAGTTNLEGSVYLPELMLVEEKMGINLTDGIPKSVLCDFLAPGLGEMIYNVEKIPGDEICKLYQHNDIEEQGRQLMNVYGDIMFVAPAVQALDAHANNNKQTTSYQYVYSVAMELNSMFPMPHWGKGGACHGDDEFFLFGPTGIAGIFDPFREDNTAQVATKMMKYWTNFAKTGNPNSDDIPDWPKYTKNDRKFIDINLQTTQGKDLFGDRMTLLLETIPELLRKNRETNKKTEL